MALIEAQKRLAENKAGDPAATLPAAPAEAGQRAPEAAADGPEGFAPGTPAPTAPLAASYAPRRAGGLR
jgi:hypothetical protein